MSDTKDKSDQDISVRQDQSEDEESKEFEFFKEHAEKFNPQRWEQALKHKLHMSSFDPRRDVPDDKLILRKLRNGQVGIFIGDDEDYEYEVTVEKSGNPDEYGSFGFIGCFAKVYSESPFIAGTLVLRFEIQNVEQSSIIKSTLRLFRWDEDLKSFIKIHTSCLVSNSDSNYVWAKIFVPGIYAVIGQNSNPLIRHVIKTLFSFRNVFSLLDSDLRKELQKKLGIALFSRELNDWFRGLNDRQIEAINKADISDGFLPLVSQDQQWNILHSLDDAQLENIHKQFLGLDLSKGILPDYTFDDYECMDIGWYSVGPENVTGAFVQVVIDPSNNDRLYAAASDGGLWRLESVASYPNPRWIPLTDQNETLQIRSVAVAKSDSNIIYIADGLGYVLRSNNRGTYWRRISNRNFVDIRKILVDPNDSNRIFVASSDGLWGSIDGGCTLDILNYGNILDIVMDPYNSSILYIGKANEGLLKSYDSGQTWQVILPWSAANSPLTPAIKIGLGYLGDDSNRTVATKFDQEIFLNRNGGRPAGIPGGGPWVSKGRPGYPGNSGYWLWCHAISIDPFDNNVILAGAIDLYRSSDGGNTWSEVMWQSHPHEDHHSIAFDPIQRNVVYVANDGGVFRSTDGGIYWTERDSDHPTGADIREKRNLNRGLVAAQFNHVGVQGDNALGNVYHSGSFGTTDLLSRWWQGIGGHSWEWANIHSDPKRLGIYYIFHSMMARQSYPLTGNQNDFISDFAPFRPTSIAVDIRSQSDVLVVGSDNPGRIMRTLDNTVDHPVWTTEPGINIGNEPIVSIVFANKSTLFARGTGMAYAASQSGRVFQKNEVRDATNWNEKGRWNVTKVKEIAINAYDTNRLYLITESQVARSQDGGATWIPIMGTGNNRLPNSEIKSIAVHPNHGRTVFLGLKTGVFITNDEGQNWYPFDTDLPNAEIMQIFWHNSSRYRPRLPSPDESYLYVATHGRGLWRRKVCL